MEICLKIKSFSVVMLTLLILSCSSDSAPPSDTPAAGEPPLVKVLKAYVENSVNLDLNVGSAIDLELIQELDDASTIKLTYSLTWAGDELILRDANNGLVTLSYNKNALVLGQTRVSFIDPSSQRVVDIDVSLTTKNTNPPAPFVTKVTIKPHSSSLTEGQRLPLDLTFTYSNGEETDADMNLVQCVSASEFITVTASCEIVALSSGVANIDIEMRDITVLDVETRIGTQIEIIPPSIINPFVTKVTIQPHSSSLIEGQRLLLDLTFTYSNGEETDADMNLVQCVSASESITITASCEIVALSSGVANIDIEMRDITVLDIETRVGTQIEIIPPSITKLTVIPERYGLTQGEDVQVIILADYNNGDRGNDVSSDYRCIIVSGDETVTFYNPCELTAIKPGFSTISIEAIDGSLFTGDIERATIEVFGPHEMMSGEVFTPTAAFFGGDTDTTLVCQPQFLLGFNSNCRITASTPGQYEVRGELTHPTKGSRMVARTIQVNPIALGNFDQLSVSNDFMINIPPGVMISVYEVGLLDSNISYKVTMSGSSLPDDISMQVLPSFNSNKTCRNTLPVLLADSRTACGFMPETDKLYIKLRHAYSASVIQVKISIEPDLNILDYAGSLRPEGIGGSYINKYNFSDLNVGEALFNGHVPANLDLPNVSRYASSDLLGMDPSLSGGEKYTVSIVFDTPNFSANSAIVFWYNEEAVGDPGGYCLPQKNIQSRTLSCTFDNAAQSYIFVEVHGNGHDNGGDNTSISNITAVDGEIGYSILLTQE